MCIPKRQNHKNCDTTNITKTSEEPVFLTDLLVTLHTDKKSVGIKAKQKLNLIERLDTICPILRICNQSPSRSAQEDLKPKP